MELGSRKEKSILWKNQNYAHIWLSINVDN